MLRWIQKAWGVVKSIFNDIVFKCKQFLARHRPVNAGVYTELKTRDRYSDGEDLLISPDSPARQLREPLKGRQQLSTGVIIESPPHTPSYEPPSYVSAVSTPKPVGLEASRSFITANSSFSSEQTSHTKIVANLPSAPTLVSSRPNTPEFKLPTTLDTANTPATPSLSQLTPEQLATETTPLVTSRTPSPL